MAVEPEPILPNTPAPKLKLNKKVQVMLICFLFATVFWFLIALSKEYVAHVKFKLSYERVPMTHLVTNELPETIKLAVKTTGFRILSYRTSRSYEPVSVDVSSKISISKEIPDNLALPSHALEADFTSLLGDEFRILSYSPDTIFFSFRNILDTKASESK